MWYIKFGLTQSVGAVGWAVSVSKGTVEAVGNVS